MHPTAFKTRLKKLGLQVTARTYHEDGKVHAMRIKLPWSDHVHWELVRQVERRRERSLGYQARLTLTRYRVCTTTTPEEVLLEVVETPGRVAPAAWQAEPYMANLSQIWLPEALAKITAEVGELLHTTVHEGPREEVKQDEL